jgi:hypothetical protein
LNSISSHGLLKNEINYQYNFFSVALVGGRGNNSGNVFARNPITGIYGPVCDDYWSIQNVRTNLFPSCFFEKFLGIFFKGILPTANTLSNDSQISNVRKTFFGLSLRFEEKIGY